MNSGDVTEESADREVRDTLGRSAEPSPDAISADNSMIEEALGILLATREMLDERLRHHYQSQEYRQPSPSPSPPIPAVQPASVYQKRLFPASAAPWDLKSSAYHPHSASMLNLYRFPSECRQHRQ